MAIDKKTIPEAWVRIASDEEVQAQIPPGAKHPYDFGFSPAMVRLTRAHGRIGPAFGRLFAEVMFSPEGELNRHEREMVAAVAAAGQDCHY